MTARARKTDETYEQYRLNLKLEEIELKMKLGGTWLWNSSKDGTIYSVMTEKGKAYTDVNPKFQEKEDVQQD